MLQSSDKKTFIKEIFTSLQGEGPYVGEKQIFVRFCRCNLKCKYCDTDFNQKDAVEYSSCELFEKLNTLDAEVVSFTGGEPLKEIEFLKDFFKKYKLNKKIYLETNGTLYKELNSIIDFVNVVSMDIKLASATEQKNRFQDNEKFLDLANKKEVFIKVVFDKNIKDEEIENVVKIAKKYNNLIVLQPKMPIDKELAFEEVFEKFYSKHKNTRLIPQVHKFLNII